MQPGQPYAPPQAAPPAKKSNTCLIVALVLIAVGVVVVAPLAAMSLYGVRRYLASAKTAEAKNTVGAIARGARQSYEREQMGDGEPTHALCGTAVPVPGLVPSGVKYMPAAKGTDFDTGDATTGWKCLRFSMTQSIYYRYSYTKGSSPIMAAKGGSAPVSSPESFEAAAEGDLDGDSTTSAFALVGEADSAGEMRIATQIFISDEFE